MFDSARGAAPLLSRTSTSRNKFGSRQKDNHPKSEYIPPCLEEIGSSSLLRRVIEDQDTVSRNK